MHVAGVYTFAARLDYRRLLADVERRLPLIPRYTQRIVPVPLQIAHPTWEEDPKFRIEHHVHRHELSGDGDEEALAQLCAELFARPLDRSRPLWELHLIEGYRRTGCALFAKVHHCMIDGASGVQLINLLMDSSPGLAPVAPRRRKRKRATLPGPWQQVTDAVFDRVRRNWQTGTRLLGALSDPERALKELRSTLTSLSSLTGTLATAPPPTPFNGPVGDRRALAWVTFSLNEVKAVRSRLGGTVNDVVLSVVAAALRQFLRTRGVQTRRLELQAMVPVNVRAAHEQRTLGNRVSMMIASLPVGVTDPVDRLRHVSAEMALLKRGPQVRQMERVVALTELIPPVLQMPLFRLQSLVQPVNTVCTNVPGPGETRYLLDTPVQRMVPFVPLAANIGLAFAVLSYGKHISIGITADAERVEDAWELQAMLAEGFEELWEATGLERISAGRKVESALMRRRAAARRGRQEAADNFTG
jgi:WS/DGAT/MGAT family acyltransferase